MNRTHGIFWTALCSLYFAAAVASARPARVLQEAATPDVEVDIVGDVDGTNPVPHKVLQDTIWIADWTFDTATSCDETGWVKIDNHIRRDSSNYWYISGNYAGVRFISGNAAALGYVNNVCCEGPNGYDNDWYYGIRMTYSGAATLSFDYLVDSEAGFDFMQVESDSACASFDRVDYYTAPAMIAAFYRKVEYSDSGLNNTTGTAQVVNKTLTNYGAGTHCVYISFFADGGYSPCDGDNPTTIGAACAVDNILLQDATGTRTENFTDGNLSNGWTFENMQDNKAFGEWARTYKHITDNDACTENTTCAWLWTDYTTPTIANDPSMAFGPGSFVVRNWLDDIIMGPWVSLASTPGASGTVLHSGASQALSSGTRRSSRTGRSAPSWTSAARRAFLAGGTRASGTRSASSAGKRSFSTRRRTSIPRPPTSSFGTAPRTGS